MLNDLLKAKKSMHLKALKNLSFPKNYLSFLAYLVKLSQKPQFRDFLDLSFLENGRKLSFFRPEFFWRVLKKSLTTYTIGSPEVLVPIEIKKNTFEDNCHIPYAAWSSGQLYPVIPRTEF